MNTRSFEDRPYANPLTSWEENWKREQNIRRQERLRAIEEKIQSAATVLSSNKGSFRSSDLLDGLYKTIGMLPKTQEEADIDVLYIGASKLLELYFEYPESTEAYQVAGLVDILRSCSEKTENPEKKVSIMRLYTHYVQEIGNGKIPRLQVWIAMKETKEKMDKLLGAS